MVCTYRSIMLFEAEGKTVFYSDDRNEWRHWLEENFETADEMIVAFPSKDPVNKGITYNDAVEEALCFGWIDSVTGKLEGYSFTKRFTPRRKGSSYSRPNIERLIWLDSKGMIHPSIRPQVVDIIYAEFVFPKDIIGSIKKNKIAWENYQNFTEPYKRIRVAYIDAARSRPEEFKKRLANFISMTEKNKIIGGYGGVDKYYRL